METAKESAKLEVLKRIGRYKKPPRIAALRNRLRRVCGDAHGVELCVLELVRESRLRVTGGAFYVPRKLQ